MPPETTAPTRAYGPYQGSRYRDHWLTPLSRAGTLHYPPRSDRPGWPHQLRLLARAGRVFQVLCSNQPSGVIASPSREPPSSARTTNLIERSFLEERRRTKIIPHAFGERAVLKLMYAALLRASRTWRRIVISEFELKQIEELRSELEREFKERTGSVVQSASHQRIYSKRGT